MLNLNKGTQNVTFVGRLYVQNVPGVTNLFKIASFHFQCDDIEGSSRHLRGFSNICHKS